MQRYFTGEIVSRLEASKILAVVVIDDPQNAVPVARSLLDGGISVMELAFRTERSLEALRQIRRGVPEMYVGAGTLLRPDQVEAAREAGAFFGVSPGLSEKVVQKALDLQFPFAPGLMTPSEIEKALGFGCRTVKLFPAEAAGGIGYMKAVWAPYKHLNLRFLPLGGLNINNAAGYMREPSVLAIGGSWIAPAALIQDKKWETIRENARAAAALKEA
ncbi:MAG: bifunctional 4-hydroxy-2-oxoglutarate aldolase/2-dehydro-3-deoxy-phosphogluconate aldolase [Thermoguttaceae bacterium]|nr:bifunctional 4-hydroxy-2-oxoglutarate aldolase/2-dehydro-3-deoxy-phosphogluconate aldolase [Thermoguttaceae bacterium]